jgi:hypothetical protein
MEARDMRHFSVAMVALFAFGCGSSAGRDGFEDGKGNEPNDLGNQPAPGPLGSSGGEQPPPNEACAAQITKATRAEVDVIVLIDTSGSMGEETTQVKNNINTFAQKIGATGLDYTVVMIAEKPQKLPFMPPGFQPPGVCVPQPLAGPDCADNAPIFHHLNEGVASTDSLQIILDKYGSYSGWLRSSAYKVFIEVTDDNSAKPWKQFDDELLAKAPAQFGDATNRRYIFNTIGGWKRNTPVLSNEKCGSAVNTSDQYQELSKLTGGIVESVCEADYSSVFDNIAKGLVTKLGCEFAFPKSQSGQTDPTSVVVNYTPGGQTSATALTQVTDQSKCGAVANAWYYDDNANPTKIVFCPATCTSAGADTAGKVEVAVGCKAPPPK